MNCAKSGQTHNRAFGGSAPKVAFLKTSDKLIQSAWGSDRRDGL